MHTSHNWARIAFAATIVVAACSDTVAPDRAVVVTDTQSAAYRNRNRAPSASISSPASGATFAAGTSVVFAGSGYDPDQGTLSGTSLQWKSDRDGSIGSGTSFSKSNLSAGTHTITLTATDSRGLTGSASRSISITAASTTTTPPPPTTNAPPVARFTVSCLLLVCTANASTSTDDVGITQYVLTWGSGQTSTSTVAQVSNTYLSAGTFAITLTVKDAAGLSNTASGSVSVADAAAAPAPTGANEPTGMTEISERTFDCIASVGCAADWQYNPTSYGGMTVVSDPTAPRSSGNVARSTIPIGFPAGEANGKMQRFFGPDAVVPAAAARVLYVSVWVKLSSNFEGNQASNNKIFYMRWRPVAGWYTGYLSFEALGSGSDPLYAGVIFGNLAASYPDDWGTRDVTIKRSNRPGFADPVAEIVRGTWNQYEFVMTMNTPGVANGSWEFWMNGVKKQNLAGMMYAGAGEPADWRFIELTPSWGGSGAASTRSFYTDYDHVYISGK